MDKDLISPTAAIAVELLRQVGHKHSEITEEVIASAFAQAYRGLLAGMEEAQNAPPPCRHSRARSPQ